MNNIQTTITNFFVQYGLQLVGAMIILFVGFLISRWIGSVLQGWLEHKQLEPPLRKLIVRVARLLLLLLTLVIALDKCGVPITPMIAAISVAGVGVGLAMQGVLGNLVAGLTIIFTKPFRVGEYVEIAGVHGLVTDIDLFSTILMHADRSRVVIPNRKIVGEILHNYGKMRQLDLAIGVAYGTNLREMFAIVRDVLNQNPRVLKDPVAAHGISFLGDSAITIGIRPWVAVTDFGPAQAELYEAILERFRTSHIEVPFPQREIRLLNSDSVKPPIP
jgi:small conductance mechanosensitive channel